MQVTLSLSEDQRMRHAGLVIEPFIRALTHRVDLAAARLSVDNGLVYVECWDIAGTRALVPVGVRALAVILARTGESRHEGLSELCRIIAKRAKEQQGGRRDLIGARAQYQPDAITEHKEAWDAVNA
jgi:hypothetical protein